MDFRGESIAPHFDMKRILFLLVFLLLAFAVTLGVVRGRAAWIGSVIPRDIVTFTATPRTIKMGDSATLLWEVSGATSVAMEWGPARHFRGSMQRRTGLPASGTMTVQPEEDTIYVLECESDFGQTCMSASVTVRVR
jgi:hypothetical protein